MAPREPVLKRLVHPGIQRAHNLESASSATMERFRTCQLLGRGSYGVVFKVQEHQTKEYWAIKQLRQHDKSMEFQGVSAATIREVSLLKELKHPSIVALKDCILDENGQLSLVLQFVDSDLYDFVAGYDGMLPPATIKSLLYHLCDGLSYIHSRNIIHRDLKPSNLLVDTMTKQLKVADFGLARVCQPSSRRMTHEVVTLWYRPPEILLGSRKYGTSADMWSVGAIFAEMVNKQILFEGQMQAEIELLFTQFRLLGTPTRQTWPTVNRLPEWNSVFPLWRKRPYNLDLDDWGKDLLDGFLEMNPQHRITAKEALKHPFLYDVAM